MPHRRSPRAAPFVPRVEALEDRQLLAVTATVTTDGTLTVRGGAENDRIRLIDNGTSGVNNVTLVANGRTVMPGVAVSRIIVRTGGGNDTVKYNLDGVLATGVSRSLFVDLGPGNNAFAAKLQGSLLARSSLSMNVNSGVGASAMSVSATSNINIASTALLTMELSGGQTGPDMTQVNYRGQLSGTIILFGQGGAGDDRLGARMVLTPGSVGGISAQYLGGPGDDTFSMNIQRILLTDRAGFTAVLNGGTGFNQAAITPGVGLRHIQRKTEF
jgi:hypothetical protein